MDKGRPYDDLNSIVNDKEDEDMEDGEKGEGEGNQQPTPSIPPPRPSFITNHPFANNNPFQPRIPPGLSGLPPPPPGLSSIFSHNPNFHPLHDTTSHENLPSNAFGPSVPPHIPRLDQGAVKQFDFRYVHSIVNYLQCLTCITSQA